MLSCIPKNKFLTPFENEKRFKKALEIANKLQGKRKSIYDSYYINIKDNYNINKI